MGKLGILGASVAMALLLGGCSSYFPQTIAGSGKAESVQKDLSGFSKIDAGSAFRVDVTRSDDYSVVINVGEKVVPYLDVRVEGDTLRIHLQSGLMGASGPLEAKVSMPVLNGLDLSGATRTSITGFKSGERLNAKISGASQLEGDIETGDVRFEVSGASRLTLSGLGQKMALEASGASQANLANYRVSEATVEVSGASKATVNVTGSLDGEVSGASTLRYTGDPTLGSVKSSGASTIQPQ